MALIAVLKGSKRSDGVQPGIVSIAWMIAYSPNHLKPRPCMASRPDGPIGEGKLLSEILPDFANDLGTLGVKLVVAHNSKFDLPVIASEFAGLGVKDPCTGLEPHCTMITSRRRWPGQSAKLSDVYTRIFKRPMKNAHNASGDVWAGAQVYCYLARNETPRPNS